jgi:hypothetical protein
VTFYYAYAKSVVAEKMSADGKPAYGGMRIFTVSARKRNRKEVSANYIKTRINIGCQHDRWMELKEALRVQTHAEEAEKLRNKCKHQYYHCACNSEIGTFVI